MLKKSYAKQKIGGNSLRSLWLSHGDNIGISSPSLLSDREKMVKTLAPNVMLGCKVRLPAKSLLEMGDNHRQKTLESRKIS
jgi:hypothetical protein